MFLMSVMNYILNFFISICFYLKISHKIFGPKFPFFAVKHNNLWLLKKLFEAGFDLEYCFIAACEIGHLEIAKYLLSIGSDVYEKEGGYGNIGYMKACREGHLHMVKYFLSIGFDVFKFWGKQTGLHVACRYGHFDLVKFFIDSGANVYQKNLWGENCLKITSFGTEITWDDKNLKYNCDKDHFQIIDFFLEKNFFRISDSDMGGILSGAGCTWFSNEEVGDEIDRVKYFVEKGFMVTNHLELAMKELKDACVHHNFRAIKFLISEGCEPQIYNPIFGRRMFKDYQALVYLFEHGAPLDEKRFWYDCHSNKKNVHLLFNAIQNRIMESSEIKNKLYQNLFDVEKVVIDIIFDFTFGYSNLETIETKILLTMSEACNFKPLDVLHQLML